MVKGKTQCPYCGKWYKNVNSHITRSHPKEEHVDTDGSTSGGGSTDALENDLAEKFLKKNKGKKKGLTVDEILNSEGDSGFNKKERDKRRAKKKKKQKRKKEVIKKMEVDFWLTDLHDAEIGVFQKERYMAKNRQFSRNLELVGAVKEEGKPDGMFGYMSDSWDEVPLEDFAKKRLVLKWFNSESVSWLGTLEEIVITSMKSSIGSNDELPAFKCIIPRYKYVVDLTKEHTKLPKLGEIYTCALKDKKEDKWHCFTFDEDRFTIGSDWSILYEDDELIGKIDEKVMNIGGKFNIEWYDEKWYKFKPLQRVVVLFTMMLKFNKEVQKKIRKLREYVELGKVTLDISAQEEKFLRNPRALRR